MKCPTCKAKLLPVDGELFCLQCGTAVRALDKNTEGGPDIEETTDPLLQKAITDVVRGPVHFKLPISGAARAGDSKSHSFSSMRSILAVPRPVVAASGSGAVLKMPDTFLSSVPVADDAPPLPVSRPVARKTKVTFSSVPLAWRWGLGIFGLFVLVNVGLSMYFSTRIYPGVHVGTVSLGGLGAAQATNILASEMPVPSVTAAVDGQTLRLDMSRLGRPDYAATVQNALGVGKNTPLPLAAVVESYFAGPIRVQFDPDAAAITSEVKAIAVSFDHSAVNAVPLIGPSGVAVIPDKPGVQLEQGLAAVRLEKAYGTSSDMTLPTTVTPATATASAYTAEVTKAQAMINLPLSITVKTVKYSPSTATIGSWLVFQIPARGLTVDQVQVAAYVSGLPGAFDRAGATNALLAALDARASLNYSASTKVTSVPKFAPVAMSLPLASYTYCASSNVAKTVASSLSDPSGWSQAGKLGFVSSSGNCNVRINLVAAGALRNLSPTCAGQSTCVVGNVADLNMINWLTAPKGWSGSLASYQTGMIDHAIGNWLGFEDASCTTKTTAIPILAAPALTLDGCSPNWYLIPSKQLNQIQPGF